jgi:hypothetical protein
VSNKTVRPPANVVATGISPSKIALSWTSSYPVTVERLVGSVWTLLTTGATGHYVDAGLYAGTTYSYRVQAVQGRRQSGWVYAAPATTLPLAAPVVDAGPDQAATVDFPATITLTGTFTCEGLRPTDTVQFMWSLANGPIAVIIDHPDLASTSVTLSAPGAYTFQFSVIVIEANGVRLQGDDTMGTILTARGTVGPPPSGPFPWSGIIDPSRAIDWSLAGVPGGIPTNRTQCGSTIAAYSGTAATINNALAACGANQYVLLGAGTFVLSDGIVHTKDNTTLRGAGPDQTILQFTGNTGNCGTGFLSLVCMGSVATGSYLPTTDFVYNSGVGWVTPWTGPYAKGTTQLTVGDTSLMAAGRIIAIDQLDETTDDGGVVNSAWCAGVANAGGSNCTNAVFSSEGGPNARHDTVDGVGLCNSGVACECRTQCQLVKIVSVDDATHVTITPGLYMPTWRSSQTPNVCAWGRTDASTGFGLGLENVTIENQAGAFGNGGNVNMNNAYGCWVKNIRSINSPRRNIGFLQVAHCEVRDSYFYGGQGAGAESYGVEHVLTADNLVINNIFEKVTQCFLGPCQGCVVAYNYTYDNYFIGGSNCTDPGTGISTCNWPGFNAAHDSGGGMYLHEGNDSGGVTQDFPHGNSPLSTFFRNHISGNDDSSVKTHYQIAFQLHAMSRANNLVGNVLGDDSLSMTYELTPVLVYDSLVGIYMLGYGFGLTVSGNIDNAVAASLLRWGNYDTVHDATQWNPAEVPTSPIARVQGNAVPANQNLPKSFFLPGQPSWWTMQFGSTPPFPPIGPDVTGGNISGLNGHAYKIPARLCFENLSNDPAYSFSPPIKIFNATSCYS